MRLGFVLVSVAFAAIALVWAASTWSQSTPGLPDRPEAATADQAAWNTLASGARDAWMTTASAIEGLTRKPQQDVNVSSALPGVISARQLIGTPIENATEGRIGSIADLVLGKDCRVDAIVVSDGGFMGIGNSQIPVKPQFISVRKNGDGKMQASTNLTEEHLDEAALSGTFMTRIEAMRNDFQKADLKTVSKILGATVVGANGQPVGHVSDLLLSPLGEAQFALLSLGNAIDRRGKQVAVTVASLHFKRAGEPLTTTMSVEQLKALAPVRGVASIAS